MNLAKVIQLMKNNCLVENVKKRCYKKTVIQFLGYTLGNNKLMPNVDRAQGIVDFKKPKTKKQMQRFLGLLNYDRTFIKNLAEQASPLYEMTKKDLAFIWNEKSENAFNQLKEKWAQKLEVELPNHNDPFVLETDASNIGLGGVLRQNNKPVAYISRVLSDAEKNYSITEKEVLAALWAMEKFKYYIGGKSFNLITDHKAMEELKIKSEFGSARIKRWFEQLEQHNFKVQYRKGAELVVSDALSRSLTEGRAISEGEELYTVKLEDIMKVHEECAHRKGIQSELREKGIQMSTKKIQAALKSCVTCMKKDKKYLKGSGFIETFYPGELFGIDILEIKRGFSIMIGIDYFTRRIFGRVLNNKEKHNAVNFLASIIKGFPIEKIITDNGKEFANNYLKEFLLKSKIQHHFCIPHYHNENGRVERANRTLRESIQKLKGPYKNNTSVAIKVYNNSKHRGIGMSPMEASKIENRAKVLLCQEKYSKEFKNRCKEIYNLGDLVLIKNENKISKHEDEFVDGGKIVDIKLFGGYVIDMGRGKKVLRHWSQLKLVNSNI